MKRLALLFSLLIAIPSACAQSVHYTDVALSGAGKPIANAPVRVCTEPVTATNPCTPLATIYSDSGLTTIKANPFTADTLGNIDFYYDSSSGAKVAIEVSCGPAVSGCGPSGVTLTSRNICIFCGETMQVNNVNIGTQPIFNFIEGTGITLTGVDDPAYNRVKLTINATPSSCDPLNVVTLYVDTAGSDTTGDGTNSNPWATIQHAIDTGIPGIVNGRYIIQLKSAGTYVGQVSLKDKLFFGDMQADTSYCASPTPQCSSVEIKGDTAATTGYIIAATAADSVSGGTTLIDVQGARLTLTGVTVQKAGIGLNLNNNAAVTLGAVYFLNNYTSIFTLNSKIYFTEELYINDCDPPFDSCETVRFDNGTIGGNPFAATYGMAGQTTTVSDSFCDQTPVIDPGAYIYFLDGGGGFTRDISYLFSDVIIGGSVNITTQDNMGLHLASGSKALILDLTINGPNNAEGIGISVDGDSHIVSESSITLGTIEKGVIMSNNSSTVRPTFTDVTTPFEGVANNNGVTTNVAGLNQSETFHDATPNYPSDPDITLNPNLGSVWKFTMTDNTTIAPISLTASTDYGTKITIIACQDGSGAHTLTQFGTSFKGLGTVSAGASTCSMQTFMLNTDGYWYAIAPMQTGM